MSDAATPVAVAVPTMDAEETDKLIHRINVMAAGLTGEEGILVIPDSKWKADVQERILYYDLGLAARLSHVARGGVIGHEIGHLRYTRPWRFPKGMSAQDKRWAFHLYNLFEDRRIELLMVEEFPGIRPGLEKLRSAFTARNVAETIAKSSPHFQFLNGLYSIIFDEKAIAAHPMALAALNQHAVEARKAVHDPSTRAMVNRIIGPESGVKSGSIFETLIELRDLDADDKKQRTDTAPPPPPVDEEDEDYAPEEWAEPPEEDSGLDLPDPADQEDQDDGTGESDGGVGDDEDGEDEDLDLPDAPDAEDVAEDEESELSDEDLDTLTPEQEQLLDDAIQDAVNSGVLEDDEQEAAEKIAEKIDAAEKEKDAASKAMEQAMKGRYMTADDKQFGIDDDEDAYDDELFPEIERPASVLGRQLDGILTENRTDRWSVIGYDSGPRIHLRKLASAGGVGETSIFRRKTSRLNRQFAVALVCDVSGSMGGEPGRQAAIALSMLAESFERVRGSEMAIYVFGTATAELKPFDRSFEDRRGKLGSVYSDFDDVMRRCGGSTDLAGGLTRANADIRARYDASWQRMCIAITDGSPNDQEAVVERRESMEHHGIECVGVGIIGGWGYGKEAMPQMFPHHANVDTADELPRLLTRLLRKRVRKA